MCDYKELLVLSYIYQKNRSYILSNLQKILGFTMSQLEDNIASLIERGFLEYKDNLLSINEKGIEAIIVNNVEAFPFELDEDDNIYNTIDHSAMLNIHDIYIPKDFLKKLKK